MTPTQELTKAARAIADWIIEDREYNLEHMQHEQRLNMALQLANIVNARRRELTAITQRADLNRLAKDFAPMLDASPKKKGGDK